MQKRHIVHALTLSLSVSFAVAGCSANLGMGDTNALSSRGGDNIEEVSGEEGEIPCDELDLILGDLEHAVHSELEALSFAIDEEIRFLEEMAHHEREAIEQSAMQAFHEVETLLNQAVEHLEMRAQARAEQIDAMFAHEQDIMNAEIDAALQAGDFGWAIEVLRMVIDHQRAWDHEVSGLGAQLDERMVHLHAQAESKIMAIEEDTLFRLEELDRGIDEEIWGLIEHLERTRDELEAQLHDEVRWLLETCDVEEAIEAQLEDADPSDDEETG